MNDIFTRIVPRDFRCERYLYRDSDTIFSLRKISLQGQSHETFTVNDIFTGIVTQYFNCEIYLCRESPTRFFMRKIYRDSPMIFSMKKSSLLGSSYEIFDAKDIFTGIAPRDFRFEIDLFRGPLTRFLCKKFIYMDSPTRYLQMILILKDESLVHYIRWMFIFK